MRQKLAIAGITFITAIALVFGAFKVGFASSDAGQTRADTGQGKITVSGEGKVKARPDTAYIDLGITTRNTSVSSAQQQTASKMNSMLKKIKALGIRSKDIRTSDYNIYRDDQTNVFVVTSDVTVTVRDIQKSGKLLDEAIRAGANNVNGISFGIEDRAKLEQQARQKAMQDAHNKASQLAGFGGLQILHPISITENQGGGIVQPYAMASSAKMAPGASTPVQPGQMDIIINVEVTYATK